MTPHDLIAAFDAMAEAPDGVERLRELVLQLAVLGRLVPQDPSDEPASVLLERIATEKARLVKNGAIRAATPLPGGSAGDAAFDTPEGWAWCRFQDLHRKLGAGSTPLGGKRTYVQEGAIFIRSQNVWNDGLRLSDAARIPASTHARMAETAVLPDDVLLNITGASIGRSAIVPSGVGAANVSQHVAILRQVAPATRLWVHLFLISPIGYACIMGAQVGISREGLSMSRLREFLIPVPPLAEQHRIVARFEELKGLLDQLEAARMARDATRSTVRDSALNALRAADATDEVEVAWNRFAERLDELLCDPADIAPLRQTILQLAVRGRLVQQDPSDEPAGVLLARIATEKARLVSAGRIAPEKPLPSPSGEDAAFDVPEGWTWCHLNDLLVEGPTNGWSPTAVERDTGVRSLKLSATTSGVFDGRHFKFVEADLPRDNPLWLKPGDLLIQRSNTPEYVGMAAIYDGAPQTFIYPDLMMRCRLSGETSVEFVHMALICPTSRLWFSEKASGTSQSMVKLNQGTVRATLLPLPPLAEQRRIVARVDELMGLLDRLEVRLTAARTAHVAFAAAAAHHLDA